MTRDQIKAVVRAKMDEVNPLDQGTTILDPQIEAQLDYAATNLLETLPSILALPVVASPLPEPANLIEDLSVDVPCPTDFLRLHKLKLDHWNRHISDLLPANHPRIDLQIYKHLKATINKPAGVLSHNGTVDIVTCYPPTGETAGANDVSEFIYVKKPDNAEALDDSLIDMLAWHASGLIYSIHGQGEFAKLCFDALQRMITTKLKYHS